MPKSITCHLNQKTITIEDAIDLRFAANQKGQPHPDFRCRDCGKPVRPHRGSEYGAGHFEHREKNTNCPPLPSTVAIATTANTNTLSEAVSPIAKTALKVAHLVFKENQRGVSFDVLFGPYLAGASRITITDPYLRAIHQQRNLMDLLETISKQAGPENAVDVHVITSADEFNRERQTENFQKMADACLGIGIRFTWEYDKTGTKHDRDITTNHGWKIVLSRGLDVFQRFERNDAFSFANQLQQHRQCKEFNVTFVKVA